MSLASLLKPRSIAVVGASQRRSRGSTIIGNLRDGGYTGEIYAVNPRYDDVLGYRCLPSVSDLPASVECVVVALGAAAACDVLEAAYARGIRAAVVLASGFGEGDSDRGRGDRLSALAAGGMAICGPNCMGFVNLRDRVVAYGAPVPRDLQRGPVAMVSQSGGLGQDAFRALTVDRELGFSYLVSCGNQLGVTIEEYVDAFIGDPDVTVVAVVAEALEQPHTLIDAARRAGAARKTLLLYQPGRTAAGRTLARSHTGALAGNAEVLAAFLGRCGVIQVDSYEELLESIALFAVMPADPTIAPEVVVVSGSGGAAAAAADVLTESGTALATLADSTKARIAAVMPEFGSVTNPIDGTGAIYDDPSLLTKLLEVLGDDPGRPLIAVPVSARRDGSVMNRRFADIMAAASRSSGSQFAAYQNVPFGGPQDSEILQTLRIARIPYLSGLTTTMKVLGGVGRRRDFWARATASDHGKAAANVVTRDETSWDFLSARTALTAFGLPVVDAALARTESEAAALFVQAAGPVAVKAEVPGLLHKSDVGCVVLGCASEAAVKDAYRTVIANARRAGFADAGQALVQPMVSGVAEAYAGIIDDAALGPAICFGLGGIFVEIFKDVTTEMAPLSHAEALRMIGRIKAAALLTGARGRPSGDVPALADLLVRLGDFAVAHAGRIRSLDLNPIVVRASGEGVVIVDIAVDAASPAEPVART